MSPDTPSPSPSAAPDEPATPAPASFEALIEALWASGVKAALKKANQDPYVETQDCHISGRDGIGSEMVAKIFTTPLYDATDEWHENTLDYTARERDEAAERVIEEALGEPQARALLAEAAEALDEDEDDLQERVAEELQERAREEGLDMLYDVAFELRGSVEAQWEESFHLPLEEPADRNATAYLPRFNETGSDWLKFLLWLNIEPADFFNLCRARAKERLADLRESVAPSQWADCEEAGLIRSWLKDQGLGRACPKAPERWPAELFEALRPAALGAWSPPQGDPACSLEALYEALSAERSDNPGFSMDLRLDADDLTQTSLLIDRFSEGGPILAPRELERCQEAHAHELYINGEAVPLARPLLILAEDARFTEYSGGSCGPLMAAALESRSEASQMEAASRSPGGHYLAHASEEDFAEELKRSAELARAYGQAASAAGLAAAEARIQALAQAAQTASEPARERLELHSSVLLDQLRKGASKNEALAAGERSGKAPRPKLAELLDLSPFGLRQSAWRSEAMRRVEAAQAKGELDERDAFGNTLLRKALLAVDGPLCHELLSRGADPMAKNAAGSPAWTAIARLGVKDQIALAERLAPFGLAGWRDQEGKTLMHRTHSVELAVALARLGLDPSTLDKAGARADARVYSDKSKAEVEQAYLESALAAAPAKKSALSL